MSVTVSESKIGISTLSTLMLISESQTKQDVAIYTMTILTTASHTTVLSSAGIGTDVGLLLASQSAGRADNHMVAVINMALLAIAITYTNAHISEYIKRKSIYLSGSMLKQIGLDAGSYSVRLKASINNTKEFGE